LGQKEKRRKTIDRCQVVLWKVHKELESFSILLGEYQSNGSEGGTFYGLSLTLKRLSKKLDKICEELSEVY